MGFFSFFNRDKKKEINEEQKKELDEGLQKSKENFFKKLAKSIAGKSKVDDAIEKYSNMRTIEGGRRSA